MPLPALNRSVRTSEPVLEVKVDPRRPLKPGRYRIQLVVEDDAGLESLPAFFTLNVTQGPVRDPLPIPRRPPGGD